MSDVSAVQTKALAIQSAIAPLLGADVLKLREEIAQLKSARAADAVGSFEIL